MKVIGYARVSTTEQASDGISLAAQRAKIAAYCSLHGLHLVCIEADEGLSGGSLDHRPAVRAVLARVQAREVVGVVIYSLSRLVRSTRDALDVAALLKKKGCALHSISEHLDTTTASGSFFFTLMAALGELERRQAAERTSMSLRHKRAQGEKIGGAVPFGFTARLVRRQGRPVKILVPLPREQSVVRGIRLQRQRGRSLRAIATALNRRKVPAKGGGQWFPTTVARVLRQAPARGAA